MGEGIDVAEARKRLEAVRAEYAKLNKYGSRYPAAALRNAEIAVEHFSGDSREDSRVPAIQEHVSMSVLASGAAVATEIVSLHLFIYQSLMALDDARKLPPATANDPLAGALNPQPSGFVSELPYNAIFLLTARTFARTFVKKNIESASRKYQDFSELIQASSKLAEALEVSPEWPKHDAEKLGDIRNRYAHGVVTPHPESKIGLTPAGKLSIEVSNELYWGYTPAQLLSECLTALKCMCRCLRTLDAMHERRASFNTVLGALARMAVTG